MQDGCECPGKKEQNGLGISLKETVDGLGISTTKQQDCLGISGQEVTEWRENIMVELRRTLVNI
jgi:hypothetical protein